MLGGVTVTALRIVTNVDVCTWTSLARTCVHAVITAQYPIALPCQNPRGLRNPTCGDMRREAPRSRGYRVGWEAQGSGGKLWYTSSARDVPSHHVSVDQTSLEPNVDAAR